MRKAIILSTVGLMIFWCATAHAGKIFGDIEVGGKPIAEGVKVAITAPLMTAESGKAEAKAVVADSTKTDKFGAYTLKVKGEGKCTLTVLWDKQSPSIEVYSYNNSTRYDLILEKAADKYILKRK